MANRVILVGRLGRDPELRQSQSGLSICTFSLATSDKFEGMERTEWHRIVIFDRQAENCQTYLKKGSLVFVEGSLRTRKWQDQQGNDRYTTEIRANRVVFLDRRGEAESRPTEEETHPNYEHKQNTELTPTVPENNKIISDWDWDEVISDVPEIPY